MHMPKLGLLQEAIPPTHSTSKSTARAAWRFEDKVYDRPDGHWQGVSSRGAHVTSVEVFVFWWIFGTVGQSVPASWRPLRTYFLVVAYLCLR